MSPAALLTSTLIAPSKLRIGQTIALDDHTIAPGKMGRMMHASFGHAA